MVPNPVIEGPTLSLVVPIYNEAQVLNDFFSVVMPILDKTSLGYEVICVNDGSRDETLPRLYETGSLLSRTQLTNSFSPSTAAVWLLS